MTNKYHVIFGTGPVGMAIMDALYKKGYSIKMVNRSGKTTEPLPDGVELIRGDLSDERVAVQAAQDAAVIYKALNPPYSKWVELFPQLQANAIAAAESSGAKLVVMENLYAYGDPNGQPMIEETPYNAHTKKGKLRAEMSRDLMAAHHARRIQVVVGRASDFIGPRVMVSAMGGDIVLKAAIKGKAAQVIGDVDTLHSYTYMPDIGKALVTLAEHDDALGQIWHVPTPKAITTRQMLELIYAEAGHPLKIQVAPKWLLRIMGLFNPDAGEMVEMIYEFDRMFIIDDTKFVKRFGWEATPLDQAIRDTVAWFKAHSSE
ncbi:MAG: NAD-dependent epimerase/dehydratase family protein [Chloroflexota bacterium]